MVSDAFNSGFKSGFAPPPLLCLLQRSWDRPVVVSCKNEGGTQQ